MRRKGFTVVELLVVLAIVVVLSVLLIWAIRDARDADRRASCQRNLQQIALVFKMYGAESKGELYPTLRKRGGQNCDQHVDEPGQLFGPDGDQLYPEYLADPSVMLCPADPDADNVVDSNAWHCQDEADQPICPCQISPVSYFYYSWIMTPDLYLPDSTNLNATDPSLSWANPAWLEAFSTRIDEITANPSADAEFDGDISWEGEGPLRSDTMYRARVGVARFFLKAGNTGPADMQVMESNLPLMHDAPNRDPSSRHAPSAADFSHRPRGGNILYVDGHVEFVHYAREWPFCSSWTLVLDSLDGSVGE